MYMRKLSGFCISLFTVLILQSCELLPGNSDKPSVSQNKATITAVGWMVENTPSDFWSASSSTKPSLVYDFTIYFSGDISASDISYARVYLPDNSSYYWTINPALYFNSAHHSIGGYTHNYNSNNPSELPIGQLTAVIELMNGTSSSYTFNIGVPGNTSTLGNYYVYNSDDEASADYPDSSVEAVKRSSVNTFSNLSGTISVAFTINGSNVHNGFIWFYDASNNYVGWSSYFIDPLSGSATSKLAGASFKNQNGQQNTMNLGQNDIFDSNGNAVTQSAFNNIQHCRVVVTDGYQYAGLSDKTYASFDYRSISSLY